MAEGLNRVMLLGNLGADPELRMTGRGHAVLKLRLATSESYKDHAGQWRDRVEWHSVIVWGKRAEALGRILSKGSRILVEGSLRTSSYDDRDGNKRHKTEVNASKVVLLGGSKGGDSYDERSERGENHSSSRQGTSRSDDDEPPIPDDDDIPF